MWLNYTIWVYLILDQRFSTWKERGCKDQKARTMRTKMKLISHQQEFQSFIHLYNTIHLIIISFIIIHLIFNHVAILDPP